MALLRGQLAAIATTTSGLIKLYTVPVSKVADVNIIIVDRSLSSTNRLYLAHIKGGGVGSVSSADYLMYYFDIGSLPDRGMPIFISGILMSAYDTLAVRSTIVGISAQVNGIEDDV